MDSKKSKKKLFAIIGSSVLAFILTVVVSVAVTLAYFGDTQDGEGTVTMGQALNWEANSVTAETELAEGKTVLPGHQGTLTVSGTIEQTTTPAYLRMKIASAAEGEGAADIELASEYVCTDGTFVSAGADGWYYLVKTADESAMQSLDASAANGKEVSYTVVYTVDKDYTNDVANDVITVSVTMEIIQAENIGTSLTEVVAVWEADDVVVD